MNRPIILRSLAIAAVLALAAVGLERAVAALGAVGLERAVAALSQAGSLARATPPGQAGPLSTPSTSRTPSVCTP
jgi:hypothetical protein